MRWIVTCLPLLLLLSACASTQGQRTARSTPHDTIRASNPCSDSLYVSLREQSFDNMNQQEFEYFQRKHAACERFRHQADQESSEARRHARDAFGSAVITSILSIGAIVLIIVGAS